MPRPFDALPGGQQSGGHPGNGSGQMDLGDNLEAGAPAAGEEWALGLPFPGRFGDEDGPGCDGEEPD